MVVPSPGLTVSQQADTLKIPGALRAGLVVALSYYVGCLIGFALRFPSSGIAFLWPPNAVLTSALLLTRPHTWWATLAGALVAHGLAHSQDGVPPGTWLCQFLGNAVQAVVAAWAVRRYSSTTPVQFDRLRDVGVVILGAALVAPAVSSFIPAFVYVNMGWAADYWLAWRARVLSNVVTVLTLVPPIVVAFSHPYVSARRVAEFALLLLGLMAADAAAVHVLSTGRAGLWGALFAPAPFLLYAAIRFGPVGLSFSLGAAALIAITGALGRYGSTVGATSVHSVMVVQMFSAVTAIPLLLLAAVIRENSLEHSTLLESQRALIESEAKNSAILRATPDLMFLLTTGGIYLNYYAKNPGELLVPPQRFLGRHMRDVLPPDLAARFARAFGKGTPEEPAIIEYSLPVDGHERFYEARIVPLEHARVLCIVRDVTERRRAEDERRKAEQALQQAQADLARMARVKALGELAATIAHEVNQPLTAIVINANACLRWLGDPVPHSSDLREALQDVVREGHRASEVIRRTRELFRNGPPEKTPLALNSAVREVLVLTRGRMETSRVMLDLELDDTMPRVMADRVQIEQVLINLVLNGIDAMQQVSNGPRVLTVRSGHRGDDALVTVRDAGEGLGRDDVERIFEPFYTTKPDGMGVGLAVSRSIIQAHGGRLWAMANDGRGATFQFTLPGLHNRHG